MEEILGIGSVIGLYNFSLSAVGIVFYVLQAFGLYTIAKRRGIAHPWMAWVPITDLWLLGSIADSYRLTARKEKKNRRTALLILTIVVIVLIIAALAVIIGAAIDLAIRADQSLNYNSHDTDLLSDFFLVYFSGAGLFLLAGAVAIAQTVMLYICLYDLYGSCDPDNKVLYLLLSILFNLAPVFVFVCRNKDLGMQTVEPQSNRYQQPQYQRPPYQQPPYQQPPYQQPPYQQPPYQQPPVTPPGSTEE